MYLLLAVLMYLPAWLSPASRLQAPGGDIAIYVWSLRWVAYALVHGHNPLYSDWLNYPWGVNLLNNTSVVFLGVLTTPLTLAFGAVVSYNVLQTLALAASAMAAYVLLRRWTSWRPAAFAGGLLYGFSPHMIAAGWGHLHLAFGPLLPLIVLCLDEIIVRQRGSATRWGIAAGTLAAAQYLISSELLADTAELGAIAIIGLAIVYRHELRTKLRHATIGLLWTFGTAAALLAYPLWFTLLGPEHGKIASTIPLASLYSSDLLGPITPTSNQLLTTTGIAHVGDRLSGGLIPFGPGAGAHDVTNAGYLGLAGLLVVIALVVRYRRVRLLRVVTVLTLIAFVAALGPALKVNGHVTGVYLPERILYSLPPLDATTPMNFGVFYSLGFAVLLGIGLDRLRSSPLTANRTWLGRAAPWLAAAIALVPLIPKAPYPMKTLSMPRFVSAQVVRAMPTGSVVMTYPPPRPATSVTMEWQASAGMRYRMVGAYMYARDGGGPFSLVPDHSITQSVLYAIWAGQPAPRLTRQMRDVMLNEIRLWRVNYVLVATGQPHAATAVALLTALLNRRPGYTSDAAVWVGPGAKSGESSG